MSSETDEKPTGQNYVMTANRLLSLFKQGRITLKPTETPETSFSEIWHKNDEFTRLLKQLMVELLVDCEAVYSDKLIIKEANSLLTNKKRGINAGTYARFKEFIGDPSFAQQTGKRPEIANYSTNDTAHAVYKACIGLMDGWKETRDDYHAAAKYMQTKNNPPQTLLESAINDAKKPLRMWVEQQIRNNVGEVPTSPEFQALVSTKIIENWSILIKELCGKTKHLNPEQQMESAIKFFSDYQAFIQLERTAQEHVYAREDSTLNKAGIKQTISAEFKRGFLQATSEQGIISMPRHKPHDYYGSKKPHAGYGNLKKK